MENNYAYIIAILILAAFLIYWELKRANKARLIFRMLAVILAVTAVFFLILPIKYQAKRKIDTKTLHFLTPGTQATDLKEGTYLTADSSILKSFGHSKVSYVPDLLYHLQSHPDLSNLIVYGYGLPTTVWKNIAVHSDYLAAAVPNGIISCSWPDLISSSETFRVEGIYNNTGNKSIKLLLYALGTPIDSVTIAADEQVPFSLQGKPKQIGKAIYKIEARLDNKVVEMEPVPFQVIERPKIKVLVLASFPDFEFKFLRNWLYEHKYEAFFRTRISKDKFSVEHINQDAKAPSILNATTFKNYDLIIADDEELGRLGSATGSLTQEIEAGLGLIVRLNEAKPLSVFTKRFRLSGGTDSISRSYQPVVVDGMQKLKPLSVSQPVFINQSAAHIPLVENQQGKVLVSLAMAGKGRIGATAITSTFNWVLNNANDDYASYWSTIMNRTARKVTEDFRYQAVSRFPVIAEQVSINFQSSTQRNLPAFAINGKLIPVQQHQWLPFYWQATFWPNTTGWNEFKLNSGAKQSIFIYNMQDWAALKAYDLIQANRMYTKSSDSPSGKANQQLELIEKQVSYWVFLGLFLICMGYLWFETKILQ